MRSIFASEGAKVVVADVNAEEEIKVAGYEVISVKLDISSEKNWEKVVKKNDRYKR